ncbi:uncharacterized protein LOC132562001, partial [Ylistrum balloti]|uniref:uncharacterized protein LOC132562001 n=1 Tax=Ylistrum balloti TaxID=509963 RepID=UPI002905DD93
MAKDEGGSWTEYGFGICETAARLGQLTGTMPQRTDPESVVAGMMRKVEMTGAYAMWTVLVVRLSLIYFLTVSIPQETDMNSYVVVPNFTEDAEFENIKRTNRAKDNKSYKTGLYNDGKTFPTEMAYHNYAINEDISVRTPNWNLMAYNSKQHMVKARWPGIYEWPDNDENSDGPEPHRARPRRASFSSTDRNGRNARNVILAVIAVLVVAVVITIIMLIVLAEGTVNLELKLEDRFQRGMENSSSPVFQSVAKQLCGENYLKISQSEPNKFNGFKPSRRGNRNGKVANGSIIARLVLTIIGQYHIPENSMYVEAITTYVGASSRLGPYTVVKRTIVVIAVSYSTFVTTTTTPQTITGTTTHGLTTTTTTSEPPEIKATTTTTPEPTTTTSEEPSTTTTTQKPASITTVHEPVAISTTTEPKGTTTPEPASITTTSAPTTNTTTSELTATTTSLEQTTSSISSEPIATTTTPEPKETTTTPTPQPAKTSITSEPSANTTTQEPTETTTTTTTRETSKTNITPETKLTTTTSETSEPTNTQRSTATTTTPEPTTTTSHEPSTTTTTQKPASITTAHEPVAISTTTEQKGTTTPEPASITTTSAPTTNTTTSEQTATTTSLEPTTSSISSEPIATTVTPEPKETTTTPTPQPAKTSITSESSANTTTPEPTAPTTTQTPQPAQTTTTPEPTETTTTVTPQPAQTTTTSSPSANTTTTEPTETTTTTTTRDPSKTNITPKTKLTTTTSETSEPSNTQKPTATTTTPEPTTITQEPTATITTPEPSNTTTTSDLSAATITPEATQSTTTSEPSKTFTTPKPTAITSETIATSTTHTTQEPSKTTFTSETSANTTTPEPTAPTTSITPQPAKTTTTSEPSANTTTQEPTETTTTTTTRETSKTNITPETKLTTTTSETSEPTNTQRSTATTTTPEPTTTTSHEPSTTTTTQKPASITTAHEPVAISTTTEPKEPIATTTTPEPKETTTTPTPQPAKTSITSEPSANTTTPEPTETTTTTTTRETSKTNITPETKLTTTTSETSEPTNTQRSTATTTTPEPTTTTSHEPSTTTTTQKPASITTAHEPVAISTTTEQKGTTTPEPASITTTSAPTTNTTTSEQTATTTSLEPTTSSISSEPIATTVTPEPTETTTTPTPQPAKTSITSESSANTTTPEPTAPTTTQTPQPAQTTTTPEPTETTTTVTPQPAQTTTTSSPSANTTTTEPTETTTTTTTRDPSKTNITPKTKLTTTTSETSEPSNTQKPTATTTTPEPTTITQEPTATITTPEPSNTTTTSDLSAATITPEATQSTTTSEPSKTFTTPKPTAITSETIATSTTHTTQEPSKTTFTSETSANTTTPEPTAPTTSITPQPAKTTTTSEPSANTTTPEPTDTTTTPTKKPQKPPSLREPLANTTTPEPTNTTTTPTPEPAITTTTAKPSANTTIPEPTETTTTTTTRETSKTNITPETKLTTTTSETSEPTNTQRSTATTTTPEPTTTTSHEPSTTTTTQKPASITTAHEPVAISTTTEQKGTTTPEPASITTTSAPTTNTTTSEQTATTTSLEPTTSSISSEPIATTVTPEPTETTTTPTPQPAKTSITSESSANTTTPEPTAPTTTQTPHPAQTTTTPEPTETTTTVTPQPAQTTTTSSPSANTTTTEPTETTTTTTTRDPSKTNITPKTKLTTTTSETSEPSNTQKPTATTTTPEPTTITQEPTATITTPEPSNTTTTSDLSAATITPEATQSTTTSEPSKTFTTPKPTAITSETIATSTTHTTQEPSKSTFTSETSANTTTPEPTAPTTSITPQPAKTTTTSEPSANTTTPEPTDTTTTPTQEPAKTSITSEPLANTTTPEPTDTTTTPTQEPAKTSITSEPLANTTTPEPTNTTTTPTPEPAITTTTAEPSANTTIPEQTETTTTETKPTATTSKTSESINTQKPTATTTTPQPLATTITPEPSAITSTPWLSEDVTTTPKAANATAASTVTPEPSTITKEPTMSTSPQPTTLTTNPESTTTIYTNESANISTNRPITTRTNPVGMKIYNKITYLHQDLLIECNIENTPNTWDKVKLISSDDSIGVVAVGYSNGTTQKDNNSYQLTLEPGDSNVTLSLLFPNTTKHCFVRSNYTCQLHSNGNIFVESMEYISIPVADAAENIHIVGPTTVNEGDSYVVNCSGDLAPSDSTLDLYTRTVNATLFTKSPINPQITNGNVTESCYLHTTKRYSLSASKTDNGTEMRCEAANSSPGSKTISSAQMILVKVAELVIETSLTPTHEDLKIECNIQNAPNTWDKVKLISSDDSIGVVAVGYSNGTTQKDNNSYQLTLEPGDSNVTLSLLFPNTTKHCFVRSIYTCQLHSNGNIFVESMEYISIPVADAAENIHIVGPTTVNEGDSYVVNCSGDLAPSDSTLDLYTRTVNATLFTKSPINPQITNGNVTESCYLHTTKRYSLSASKTDNGTEMRCEAANSSPGSKTISSAQMILVKVAELVIETSLTPTHEDLKIECNIQNAPNTWDKVKLISSDDSIGVVAVGYSNGTTQKDNNSYQLTLEPGDSNVTLSLLFPNTTKHCFVRSNYTCQLHSNGNIFVESMEYISIPDAAENIHIVGPTTVNEGDSYVVNCSGDLAPSDSTLDLYTRTVNATLFTKSPINPQITNGNVTESCYLHTTKRYSLSASKTDNGTEMRCEAANSSPGSKTISSAQMILVKVAELVIETSLTPTHEDLKIECNIQNAPNTWDKVKLISSDDSIGVVAVGYSNGTTQKDNNSYQLTLEPGDSNVTLSLLFPNTTKHCFVRSIYTCQLHSNGNIFVESMEYISIPVADAAENIHIVGPTTVNEGDSYVVNCSGDLAPSDSTLDLYTRTVNATLFTKSPINPQITNGNVTESCYLHTTKRYSLSASKTDNGTEMRCEAANSSPGSKTISSAQMILVKVAELVIETSLTPAHEDLKIECNIQNTPNTWDKVKLISSDDSIGVVAVGYSNGTTQKDNNSYQLTLEPGDSNVTLSLLFPNTTKHCFVRSNYTCQLHSNGNIFVESMEYISIPDAAENIHIVGPTTVNEGDSYVVNCSGDLAPSDSTLDLYTRTVNATLFTKSPINPQITNGNVTESCYLHTTKRYSLSASKTDNGTEMRCEAANSSPGSKTISSAQMILVKVAELVIETSLTPAHEDLKIECNIQNTPNTWDKVKLISSDDSIGVVAVGYSNGTTQKDNNSYQLTLEPGDSNVTLSLLFPNTTKHCFVRSNYTCQLHSNGNIFVESMEYISIPVADAAENIHIVGPTTVNEGDSYVVNCSGDLAPSDSTLDLYTRTVNATLFTKSPINPQITNGNVTESCYLHTTKRYSLSASKTDNGTEMRCEAANSSPGSKTISSAQMILVKVAELVIETSLTPAHEDLKIECNIQNTPNTWDKVKLISSDDSIGVVAVGYSNGTTQKDNNSYQLTLEPGDSNVTLSLLFPNTTKHCFVRSNYTCQLHSNGNIFVESMEYISIPDAAENIHIVGPTTVNEGDSYVVNCSGDLAPSDSTLDLYTRTVNATLFTKSPINPQITNGNVTESCYLHTTKRYSLSASKTDNGTEMRCEAANSSPGSKTISSAQMILVKVAELVIETSLTPAHEDLKIECNIQNTPNTWDKVKLISSDDSIGVVAVGYSNGTTQKDNNSYQLTLEPGDSNVTLSLLFPNTTKHCFVRSNYTCQLHSNGNIFVESMEYISIPVADAAENIHIVGPTTVNEGDSYVVNCSGDLAPSDSTLDLYTRTVNATLFTKSPINPQITNGNVTESCYLHTTKRYSLSASKTDNGTEMRCEAANSSPGSKTISSAQMILVKVAELVIETSLTPAHEDLKIECNIQNTPNTWDKVKLISSDDSIGVVAVGYSNGTTQKDNNSYQLTLEPGDSNVTLSLLFPNTTKHCFVRSNYTCQLHSNGNIFVESMEYISIPDAAENIHIVGPTTVNEGDSYVVNCSGDLAPSDSTLDLYTRTVNATLFTKSPINPQITNGNVTESCYLHTTKRYSLSASKTDNGTEMRCEAANSSPGSKTISSAQMILVKVAELVIETSLTPAHEDLKIECNIQNTPNTWDKVKLISSDDSIGVVAVGYSNGTTQKDNNSYQLTLEPGDSNVTLSLLFPNTTKHCFVRSNYTCQLHSNGNIFVESMEYISIPVADAAENIHIVGPTTVNEGDSYVVNCSGDLAPSDSTLDLYTRTVNATLFTKSPINPQITNGNVTESCYLHTTKRYSLSASKTDNGTEMRCEAANSSPGSKTISSAQM